MARDYLAIQGSSVALECAFSSGGRTGTQLCNCLKPVTFEAIQILKDGYQTDLISASEEAAAYAAGSLNRFWENESSDEENYESS